MTTKNSHKIRRNILTDDEVNIVGAKLREVLKESFGDLIAVSDNDIEDNLRFHPVSLRCQDAREARGITLKVAATALRVPQYRLKDIEGGILKNVVPDILFKYIEFLELKVWFGRWEKANRALGSRLELNKVAI